MSQQTLDELANKYGTDKGTLFNGPCRHGYAPFYDSLLSHMREKPIKLLEIGVWLEVSPYGGESIYMWRDYFSKAEIYAFDIRDMSNHPAITNDNRNHFYRGDQGDRQNLTDMYKCFNELQFDFVLEDGSHRANHQAISFGHIFQYVKSGGIYFLEDITIPGHRNCNGMNNDETYYSLVNFNNTGKFVSSYITEDEKFYLENNISKIILHRDLQNSWITAAIFKK